MKKNLKLFTILSVLILLIPICNFIYQKIYSNPGYIIKKASNTNLKNKIGEFLTHPSNNNPILIDVIQNAKDEAEALELIQLLIPHKANVNAQTKNSTSLLWAIACNYVEVIKLLLRHNVELNANNEHFGPALILATGLSNKDILKLLLEAGADIEIKDNRTFFPNGDLIKSEGRCGTALIYAVLNKDIETVKLLLTHRADVNAKTVGGMTPLMTASIYNDIEIAKLLLAHRADVNAKTFEGMTSLMAACLHNNIEMVKLLINHGAFINDQSQKGDTALTCAIFSGATEIVRYLTNYIPNIDNQDNMCGEKPCLPA